MHTGMHLMTAVYILPLKSADVDEAYNIKNDTIKTDLWKSSLTNELFIIS